MLHPFLFSALFLAAQPTELVLDEPRPTAQLSLAIVAPDLTGPWKLTAENRSEETLRFAADSRLLWLEIEPPAEVLLDVGAVDVAPARGRGAGAVRPKAKPKAPKVVQCKLPGELRPSGVVDERALLLRPGERYEEVFSPSLFCFSNAEAAALVPGARVTAHLGFAIPPRGRRAKPPIVRGPFVAEPARADSALGPAKEIVADAFTLVAPPPSARSESASDGDARSSDTGAPRIELFVPPRVDATNERTVTITARLKNTGGRPALVHARRDNMVFHVDGPSESADCGQPTDARTIPRDRFSELKPKAALAVDVWVGEMCSDVVFDRPGLYRVSVSMAFPKTTEPTSIKPWVEQVTASEPVLVRVREGRLPYYASPPEALGGKR